ncbi:MAG TPA: sigma-70 family RNA polymerase sigma factor [Flavobacteriales bacterium]|nr:sigma-70 family RNA polymerase sigma factor [Flavobacteriales bacterium]
MSAQHDNINKLADHLFRHEAGRMVAILTKIFGTENLETAEDVVQDTIIQAMNTWKLKGIPENPSAWLFSVARNKAVDVIRRNKHSKNYDFNSGEKALLKSEYTMVTTMENYFKEEAVKDEMLQMMFACCHPGISAENQVTLILKTLSGFSTTEIAHAFLVPEDTVSKRLYRTKEFFRSTKIKLEMPHENEIRSRTGAVLNAIYLIFNEGYNSAHSEELIRRDVIDEAFLLCKLLSENKLTGLPEVFALMALMCFHAARLNARLTGNGEIILLENQDRSKWDREMIDIGNYYMNRSAFGDEISAYHIEAAIAYEHCIASTFNETNWKKVLQYYDWLLKITPSPIVELNRAIAVMKVNGAKEALEIMLEIKEQPILQKYYIAHAFLGEIYAGLGDENNAIASYQKAMVLTQSIAEQSLLRKKIEKLLQA